ncbi:MAG: hypothetical protein AB4911_02445 [Oscillochloridaceae bacterium umkhey_bin13]
MTTQAITDWADRWLGGFCTVGALGGLPVRGPDYATHPPLQDMLTLPPSAELPQVALPTAQAAWSDALGGVPVVLLANVDRARTLLLRALEVQPGEPVGLPANATRDLAEAVKHQPATPRWLDLGPELALLTDQAHLRGVRVIWTQPCGGTWTTPAPDGMALLVDASDSLPDLGVIDQSGATATIYGLHLGTNPRRTGALVVCHHPALALALNAITKAADYLGVRWATNPARAGWYANLMTEWYGSDHDAFRPLGVPDRSSII